MRANLFFAIDLPLMARQAIEGYAAQWRRSLGERPGLRWYGVDDYHITLKFLGAHEPCEASALAAAGERARELFQAGNIGAASISVKPAGAGAFPSLERPRVLWVSAEPVAQMIDLAGCLDSGCEEYGISRENRTFTPHITVARSRDSRAIQLPVCGGDLFPEIHQNSFALMRTLTPQERKSGRMPRYNIVRTFAL